VQNPILEQASTVTYGASAVTVLSGLTINEWGVVAGIMLGAATFVINWWYKHRMYIHAKIMNEKK